MTRSVVSREHRHEKPKNSEAKPKVTKKVKPVIEPKKVVAEPIAVTEPVKQEIPQETNDTGSIKRPKKSVKDIRAELKGVMDAPAAKASK